ncbi:MAG: hypothetical protein L6Q76_22345 [Polyangiaceae bacterium]|nr:hypothetical protein [Polyangiaceae bacterium]
MNVRRGLVVAAALLSLAACNDKEEDTTPVAPVPTPAPTPAPTPTGDLKVDTAPKMTIQPRVKGELDGRGEGIAGTPMATPGSVASVQSPTGWTSSKSGDFTVAASPDKKAQLAAAAVGAEGTAGKLPTAATALGLTACEWGTPETVAVGKGRLAATAADGVCSRGTTQVRAAYVAPNAEKLIVVGTWDEGGDSAGVFGAMRTIAKATGGGDPTGIAACCAALRSNAASAPPEHQSSMLLAAGVCDTLRNDPQGRAVLAQVRGMLAGANGPSSCR